MISESYYWRKEILKISNRIKRRVKNHKQWNDIDYGNFEKDIMFGFYIIRKLMEASKLDNKLCATNIECIVYRNNGKAINFRNNHRFFEFYDFENGNKQKCDLKFLINQFVHSYIFKPTFEVVDEKIIDLLEDENKSEEEKTELFCNSEKYVSGIYFNSDSNKRKSIYEIEVLKIIELFKAVGKCNITRVEMRFNGKKQDYDIVQYAEKMKLPSEIKKIIDKFEHNNS